MQPVRRFTPSLWFGLGWAVAVLAPLGLLINPQVNFSRDWPTHFWMVGYYGDYFRAHGGFPIVMNNGVAVGVAVPVFYTWLLYPVLGVLAAGVGTAMALRLALLVMVAIQFHAVLAAGRKIFGHAGLAWAVAVSVIWATYSLSNLYSRGALAEYFAAGFLFTAIGFGASAAIETGSSSRRFHAWLAGFFLLLAVCTHPPTAVLAGAFTLLLAAAWVVGCRRGAIQISRRGLLWLAGGVLAGALILSPWVYANATLGSRLLVTQDNDGFIFRPENLDSFSNRFAPFPYDQVTMKYGVYGDEHGTPYLEAPIDFVLLVFLVWNLELLRRGARDEREERADSASLARPIIIVAIGWFLLLAAMSVSPWLAGCFAFFAPYIQYVYRLVTHCNAALLVAVFATGWLVTRRDGYVHFRPSTNLVVAVGLTIAVFGLGIKWQHSVATESPADNAGTLAMGNPTSLTRAYATPAMLRPLTVPEIEGAVPLRFPVDQGDVRFGDMSPATIRLSQPGWVVTNAVVFPWMELQRDGTKPPPLHLARLEHFQAVYLSAGTHEIRPVWRPTPTWTVLHGLSQAGFFLVVAVTIVWAAVRVYSSRKDQPRSPEPPAAA